MTWKRRVRMVASVLVVAGPVAAAQTPSPAHAGAWIISGNATFDHVDRDSPEGSQTNVSIAPSALGFIGNHFAVGGTVVGAYSKTSEGHTRAVGIGPSARYYFGTPTNGWLPFVSASVLPQWEHVSEVVVFPEGSAEALDGRDVVADGSFGLTRLVASHVGVTGEAYYTRTWVTANLGDVHEPTTHTTAYGLRFGITAFVH